MQAGHQAAATAVDSDSDQEDFDQYSELDAFDTEEVEVSPDDEQALAAFMVSKSCTMQFVRLLQSAVMTCEYTCTYSRLMYSLWFLCSIVVLRCA